jgi:hypothetical protein
VLNVVFIFFFNNKEITEEIITKKEKKEEICNSIYLKLKIKKLWCI